MIFDFLGMNFVLLDTIFDFSGAKLLLFGCGFLVFGNGILAEFQVRVSSLSTTPKNEIAKNTSVEPYLAPEFSLIRNGEVSIFCESQNQYLNTYPLNVTPTP